MTQLRNEDIGDNEPIPLAEAAKVFFGGRLTKSALRTEAGKGNLEIIRIANEDFVTRSAIRQMIDKCTIKANRMDVPPALEKHTKSGLTAQAALRARLAASKDR